MVSDPQELARQLGSLPRPVRLVFFTQTFGCDSCLGARQVLDHLASLSDQVSVEEVNLVLDTEKVAQYGVDRAPAVAVVGERDLGLRYYGVPGGYELAALADAVTVAATGETGLSTETLALVSAVTDPIDIKVFVTPTCVYCPQAAALAYRLAAASDHIRTTVIEATEFPDLAQQYRVTGVPKTVVDDKVEILGAQPEAVFVKEALSATLPEQPPAPER